MSNSEKNAFFSKPFNGPILIFWNLILCTFLCTKIKKITMEHFFSLDACLHSMWGRNPSSLQYVTSGAPENSAAANSSDHLSAGRQQQSDGKAKWPLFHISFAREISKWYFLSHTLPKASTTAKWIQSTSPTCGTLPASYCSHYS